MQIVTYSERRLVKRHRGTMPVISDLSSRWYRSSGKRHRAHRRRDTRRV